MMWQAIGVLQPPNKWTDQYLLHQKKEYTRRPSPNNALVVRKHCFPCDNGRSSIGGHRALSCQATAAGQAPAPAAGKCESEADGPRRMPPLPYTVRLRLAAFAAAQRPDGSVRTTLFKFGDLQASADPCASGVRSADVTVDAARGLWARVFSPAAPPPAPLPVVVYFHGGGFVLFSAASRLYDALCRRLCRELGAVVVSVDYRLAPRHRCPAAYDDGVAALRFLDANAHALLPVPVDVSSCFLAGDSAGGNIAHHVAQRWLSMSSSSSSSTPTRLRIAGAVLIQPLFGGEERTPAELELADVCSSLTLAGADYCWREFLPEGATRDHAAACVRRRDVGPSFPPAMVVAGGFDPLKDRHASYAELLRDAGSNPVRLAEYPDAIHGFYLFPEIADSGKLVADMKRFVHEHKRVL